jgi:heme ABC exporter ATP-binding subunit CcmA
MPPVVSLTDAVTLLGRFPALAGATLDVAPGEIVLLRGPNGAGKSTLLRLCAGLLDLAQGSATVLGHDLADDRQRHAVRARVGYLGHATALYDDLTVGDNVRFWARAAGVRDDGEVRQVLAHLGLDGRLADVAVHKLSAGQRRRTSIAVLLARRPELWLLDEPHAGLDADGRDLLDDLVRRAAAAGATVLVASHELDRAEPLAHRIANVVAGRVQIDEVRRVP